MGVISTRALARKKRFSNSKQNTQKKTYRMWATKSGDIAAFTSDPEFTPNDTWVSIDIPDDKLREFTGRQVNFSKYCVLFAGSGESKIVQRQPLHSPKFKNSLIEVNSTTTPNINVEALKKCLRVTLVGNVQSHIIDNKLSFFITRTADPHFLLESLELDMNELQTGGHVDIVIQLVYNSKIHSIYTYAAPENDQGSSFE